jgi:hypothetical protein
MRISAKAEYAVRALLVLAEEGPDPVKAERVADAQKIPLRLLEAVTLADVAADDLPAVVHEMLDRPEAWEPH